MSLTGGVGVSKALVKAAAVGCSVLLAAGFVSYRAGAFDSFLRPTPAPVDSDPAPAADATPTPATDPPAAQNPLTPPVILYSSKSGAIVTPPAPSVGPSTTPAQKPPTFIGGSKSIAPLIPPPPTSQSPNPAK
jgi:hypothetical protein